MICFPNCKINIGLNILSKRPDGFHAIQSVFYPVALYDALEITPTPKTDIKIHGNAVQGKLSDNLIFKAWDLLNQSYNIEPIEFNLLKKIPSGGGLGGGSADGSFALKLLNDYFRLEISTEQLEEFAARLGSDCPFFIRNKPAIVTGRGEFIEPIQLDLSGKYLALVNPKIHISTQEAFQLIEPKFRESISENILSEAPISEWNNFLTNDFQEPVLKKYPVISTIKKELENLGAQYTSLSGTGSTFYGIFHEKPTLDSLSNDYDKWLVDL